MAGEVVSLKVELFKGDGSTDVRRKCSVEKVTTQIKNLNEFESSNGGGYGTEERVGGEIKVHQTCKDPNVRRYLTGKQGIGGKI